MKKGQVTTVSGKKCKLTCTRGTLYCRMHQNQNKSANKGKTPIRGKVPAKKAKKAINVEISQPGDDFKTNGIEIPFELWTMVADDLDLYGIRKLLLTCKHMYHFLV